VFPHLYLLLYELAIGKLQEKEQLINAAVLSTVY